MHYKGFPSGKVHYGESLKNAALRELSEKTGLNGINLNLRGNFIMKFTTGHEVVNHIIGYVYYGETSADTELSFEMEHYRSYWGEAEELYQDNQFKGHPEIFDLLSNTPRKQLFFAEYEFNSDF